MAKVGSIGAGNMGYAFLKGALKTYDKADLIFTDANEGRMRQVYAETSVRFAESNAECASHSAIVVLAVKPQVMPQVLKSIVNVLTPQHIVISMAAGWSIQALKNALGNDRRIVRIMPNTPALIGHGMTGMSCRPEEFSRAEQDEVAGLLAALGKVELVPENLMDAVTCVSGSSPAYVYMFIEALADGAVRCGMPRAQAYRFAAQAVEGAAAMVAETGRHPAELKDAVCSPAGTTIEGVAALEECGFRAAVLSAMDACRERCEEMKM